MSKTIEKFAARLDEFIAQDPEQTKAEPDQEADREPNAPEPVARRESIGPEGVSLTNVADITNASSVTMKKRTLFSAAHNTMLDTTFASPAGVARKKNRFLSATQNGEDTMFLPPTSSTQASSTMMLDLTRKRRSEEVVGGGDDDDSDSEIEFKRPEKILRQDQVCPRPINNLIYGRELKTMSRLS